MTYDEELARRVRKLVPGGTLRRMFGGIGIMEGGHMVAGVSHADLIVRIPTEETDRRLKEPGVIPMMSGRAMRGWVKVRGSFLQDDETLSKWVERSRSVGRSLPAKQTLPTHRNAFVL